MVLDKGCLCARVFLSVNGQAMLNVGLLYILYIYVCNS